MPPLTLGASTLASSLGVAFVVSLLVTPLIRMAALRFGSESDSSSNTSSSSDTPCIPALGGLAVALATVVTLGLFDPSSLALLVVALCAASIGFIDDLRPLSPTTKLFLLGGVGLVGWLLGLRLDQLPGALDAMLTVACFVWLANATNVLDMADGLLPSQGIIVCVGMFAVGWLGGLPDLLFPAIALAGALGGFLIYNWYPARIYLGDTGSLFVGVYLCGMAITSADALTGPARIVTPALLLAMPTFEAIFLMVVRTAKGRVPWRPSVDHPAQRLVTLGMGVRGAVVRLSMVGIAMTFAGVGALFLSPPSVYVLFAGCVFAMIFLGVGLNRVDVEGDGVDGRPLRVFSKNWLVTRLVHRAMAEEAEHVHGRLLDVGCGRRPYLALFKGQVTDYIGLERDGSRYADTPPDVRGDGNALPFSTGVFDTVVSNQVLEHVPEPAYAVVEMARVMRPGARVIITAPHIWGIHEEPHDYFRFTPYGLTYMAERAGLVVERVRPLGGYWITAGARLCYYLEYFARGPFRLPVAVFWALIQSAAVWLDGVHRVDGDAWNHLMVARKPEDG
jgi:UDP-N-acetylmuramyl pentapeptide phosphotransferase/UDP-N-acetylglucosamine-1-phosphate transferase/SAM-dependent methyltransferase